MVKISPNSLNQFKKVNEFGIFFCSTENVDDPYDCSEQIIETVPGGYDCSEQIIETVSDAEIASSDENE